MWRPYSPAVLGSHSPQPQIRSPQLCYESNIPNSHAGKECPVRFIRIFGAPLPGWIRDGRKDTAALTGDGAAMPRPTRGALAKY